MTIKEIDPEAPAPLLQETVVTQRPPQKTTERRRSVALVTQAIWFVVGIFEALLALRLVLLFSGANPAADFTQLIFGLTRPLVFVFLGIFPNLTSGAFEIEPASLVAMVVYFLIGMGLARLVWILYGEPKEIA